MNQISLILDLTDNIRKCIRIIEKIAVDDGDAEAAKTKEDAIDILNAACDRMLTLYSEKIDDGELVKVINYVEARSNELVKLVISKLEKPVKKEEKTEEVKAVPTKSGFNRSGFNNAIKEALAEDQTYSKNILEKITNILKEETETKHAKSDAAVNLKEWIFRNEEE